MAELRLFCHACWNKLQCCVCGGVVRDESPIVQPVHPSGPQRPSGMFQHPSMWQPDTPMDRLHATQDAYIASLYETVHYGVDPAGDAVEKLAVEIYTYLLDET